jgi:hypothetical protein
MATLLVASQVMASPIEFVNLLVIMAIGRMFEAENILSRKLLIFLFPSQTYKLQKSLNLILENLRLLALDAFLWFMLGMCLMENNGLITVQHRYTSLSLDRKKAFPRGAMSAPFRLLNILQRNHPKSAATSVK